MKTVIKSVAGIASFSLLAVLMNSAHADEMPFAGSWAFSSGPDQVKALGTYTPISGNKFVGIASGINFDWTLGGMKPTATHGTPSHGAFEKKGKDRISFVEIAYALDSSDKAVYIIKATGDKILKDKDTMSVENVVMHIYNDPENANPLTDTADLVISGGASPSMIGHRIKP